MEIYIMTDLEEVAGVINFDDYCTPEGRYYEVARELLIKEVNAAIEGLLEGRMNSSWLTATDMEV
jgi:D-aminopeptidase